MSFTPIQQEDIQYFIENPMALVLAKSAYCHGIQDGMNQGGLFCFSGDEFEKMPFMSVIREAWKYDNPIPDRAKDVDELIAHVAALSQQPSRGGKE